MAGRWQIKSSGGNTFVILQWLLQNVPRNCFVVISARMVILIVVNLKVILNFCPRHPFSRLDLSFLRTAYHSKDWCLKGLWFSGVWPNVSVIERAHPRQMLSSPEPAQTHSSPSVVSSTPHMSFCTQCFQAIFFDQLMTENCQNNENLTHIAYPMATIVDVDSIVRLKGFGKQPFNQDASPNPKHHHGNARVEWHYELTNKPRVETAVKSNESLTIVPHCRCITGKG